MKILKLFRYLKKIRLIARIILPWKNLSKRNQRILTGVSLFILVISVPFIIYLLKYAGSTEAAWFDTSFSFRQRVDVTNSGSAQTDFQISFTLSTSTLISAGKMQSDCDDIRVTDVNGKLLPHWTEKLSSSACNTTTTKIWTKLSSIDTTGNTIYVYYGNPQAIGIESGKKVFVYFDDFNISNLSDLFTVADPTGTQITESGGKLNFTTGNSAWNQSVYLTNSIARGDMAMEYDYQWTSNNASFDAFMAGWKDDGSGASYANLVYAIYNDSGDTCTTCSVSAYEDANFRGVQTGSWIKDSNYKVRVRMRNSGGAFYDQSTNGGITFTNSYTSTYSTESTLHPAWMFFSGTHNVDNFFVRKDAATLPTVASPTNEENGPGPVGWWKLNEGTGTTANNSSRYTTAGTITQATWKTKDQCVEGSCLYFDGSGDYVTIPSTDQNNFSQSQNFSVSTWVRIPEIQVDNATIQDSIIEKWDGPGGYPYVIRVNTQSSGDPGKVTAARYDGTNNPTVSSSRALNDNKWHFVSFVKAGSTLILYVDGIQSNSTTDTTSSSTANSAALLIGRRGTGANQFTGSVDDVRIYNYTRTAAQIKADYNRGAEVLGAVADQNLSNGLVGYWKTDGFDPSSISNLAMWEKADAITGVSNGGAVATWSDSSGNGRDLTQATSGNRPTYQTNVVNGKPVVRFSAASSQHITNSTNFTTPVTVIYVGKQTGGANQRVLTSVGNNWLLGFWNGAKNVAYLNGWVAGAGVPGSPATDTSWHVYSAVETGSLSSVYGDGTLLASNASGVAGPNGISIGCWAFSGVTECSNADVAEVLVYNSALSGNDRAAIENYLNRKYALNSVTESYQAYLQDSSGNSNDGTAVGGASSTTIGKFGNAGTFDGTNDYVTMTSSSSLNPTTGITMSAWVKRNSTGTRQIFLGKGDALSNATTQYWLELNASNQIYAYVSNGTTSTASTFTDLTITDTTTWHNIIATWDGTSVKAYLDGKQSSITDTAVTGSLNTSSTNFSIGRVGTLNSFYFNGSIDETRIYNRALSPAEVSQIYNFAPGPIAQWNFEEGSGTTLNDTSGNGFNGTLTNGPAWSRGKYGKGLDFDGSNDYVTVADYANLSSTTKTLEAWVKMDSLGTDDLLVGKGAEEWFGYNANAAIGCAASKFGFAIFNGTAWACASSTTTPATGVWYHLTGTYDGTNIRLYINGVLEGGPTAQTNPVDTVNAFNIGSYDGAPTTYATDAIIDQVKLYNYARTAGQIAEDLNAGHPLGGSPVGSPVIYYKFNEGYGATVNNSSGNNSYSGTTYNDISWNQNGKFGRALSFGGSTAQVVANSSSGLTFTGADLTLSAWIKPNETDNGWIISKPWNAVGDYNYYLRYDSAGTITFFLGGATTFSLTTTETIPANTWHQVVATIQGSTNTVGIYIDGKLSKTGTNTIASWTPPSANDNRNLVVGCVFPYATNTCAGSTAFDFNGLIDEVKVYNGYLSAAQIKVDYNQGSGLTLGATSNTSGLSGGNVASSSASAEYCIPGDTTTCTAPIGRWDFEEGSGNSTNDTSSNGKTGTITSASRTPGKYGKGLLFNGSSDFVTVTNADADLYDPATANFSLEAWFKTTASNGTIMSTNNNALADQFRLGITSGKAFFSFDVGDSSSPTIQSTANYNDGRWHHIVGTRTAARTGNLYVDGVLLVTQDVGGVGSAVDINSNMFFGEYPDGTLKFTGTIDGIKYFNYARSGAQVAWNYNQGKPIAHYKFDECQGATLGDSMNLSSATLTVGASGTQASIGTCSTSSTARFNGVSGKYNYSVNFDGTDDVATVSNTNSPFRQSGAITYSFWFNAASTSPGWVAGTRVSGGHGSGGVQINSGTIYFYWTPSSPVSDRNYSASPPTITTGTWHHVAIVISFSGTGTGQIYYDGAPLTTTLSGSVTTATPDTSFNVASVDHIGGRFINSQLYFTGKLDDLRVYNYPITKQQVRTVMNQDGAIRYGPQTGAP